MKQKVSRVCAWCGKHMSGPRSTRGVMVSHGICPKCLKQMEEELDRLTKNPEVLVLNPGRGGAAARREVERLWEKFHFSSPGEVYEISDRDVPKGTPGALMVIGRLESLIYRVPNESRKDGLLFEHEFSDEGDGVSQTDDVFDGTRPLLCADADGQLYIIGGSYSVEARGIVG